MMTLYHCIDKDRTPETTEGDGEEGGSEGEPADLNGNGLGTEGDGEEPDSEGDPRYLDGHGLGMREGLGHTNLIFCFSDSAGLFLADFKKKKKKKFCN